MCVAAGGRGEPSLGICASTESLAPHAVYCRPVTTSPQQAAADEEVKLAAAESEDDLEGGGGGGGWSEWRDLAPAQGSLEATPEEGACAGRAYEPWRSTGLLTVIVV